MNSKMNRAIQAIALTLVVSVSSLFAGTPLMNSKTVAGVLQTKSAVILNGNIAEDGITVLSGSQLKTTNLPATVQIPQVGTVQLERDTVATLNFTSEAVTLNVEAGNGRILASDGIKTNVLGASESSSRVNPRRAGNSAAWWLLGIGIAATVVIIAIASNDDDASSK